MRYMITQFKKGFFAACWFIAAIVTAWWALAAWNAWMQNAATGSQLSSANWNAIVQNVNDLNARIPGSGVKAWVNFDGRAANCASTCVMNGYAGISSVVRNGEWDYTINFSPSLQDGNYAISWMSVPYSSSNLTGVSMVTLYPSWTATTLPLVKTANSVRILTGNPYTWAPGDSWNVSISIIR